MVKFDIYEAKLGENYYSIQVEIFSNGYVSETLHTTALDQHLGGDEILTSFDTCSLASFSLQTQYK